MSSDIAVCLNVYSVKHLIRIIDTNLIKYEGKSTFFKVYPDMTIFSAILRPYRCIGSFDVTIPRYNDIILLLPSRIVISGFGCHFELFIWVSLECTSITV